MDRHQQELRRAAAQAFAESLDRLADCFESVGRSAFESGEASATAEHPTAERSPEPKEQPPLEQVTNLEPLDQPQESSPQS
jgi:hypothetical protein